MGVVKFTRENARENTRESSEFTADQASEPQISEEELYKRLRAVLQRKHAKKKTRPVSPVTVIARAAQPRRPFTPMGTSQVNPFDMIAEWLGTLQRQGAGRPVEAIISIRHENHGNDASPEPQPQAPSKAPLQEQAQSTPRADPRQALPSNPPGDPKFWGAWIEHHDQMKRLALGLMRGNQADAEDALSAAMLRAHKAYDSTQIRNAAAWFNRLVRNSCIDLYRHKTRTPSYAEMPEEVTDTGQDTLAHIVRSRSSEEELLSNEGLFETMGCIFELPEDLMEPLLLRCLQERSYDEIALQMGLTNAAVRKRVQLARRHLVQTMDKAD